MARALLVFALRACLPLLCFALLLSALLSEVSALSSGLRALSSGLAGVRVASKSNSRIVSDF